MRVAIGGFSHETNSFAFEPTTMAHFTSNGYGGILRGESLFGAKFVDVCTKGFLEVLEREGAEIIPTLHAFAEPSGEIETSTFDAIVSEICENLKSAAPLDGVLLDLHGAMVASDYPDGEAEILKRVRGVVGERTVICASLDLHGNLSQESLELADYMDAYRTYPHVDMPETGRRAAEALLRILAKRKTKPGFKPSLEVWRSPFLMPFNRQNTFEPPVQEIYDMVKRLDDDDDALFGVSVMMGFTLADAHDTGPCAFAYADNKKAAARAVEKLGGMVLDHEEHFVSQLTSPQDAAERAAAWTGDQPLVIADVQDNPGGGAMSDTNELLTALIDASAKDVAIAILFDPETAAAAWDAGEGATTIFEIGGKRHDGGRPFVHEATVEKLYDGAFKMQGPIMSGLERSLGRTALLNVSGVRVVVSSIRAQCLDQVFFKAVGVEPSEQKALVIKSTLHYRAAFGPIAGDVIEAETPGALTFDTSKLNYRRLRKGVRLFGKGPKHT